MARISKLILVLFSDENMQPREYCFIDLDTTYLEENLADLGGVEVGCGTPYLSSFWGVPFL